MILEIDFNSDEAIYVQLRNQIIMGIVCAEFADGESKKENHFHLSVS